ncbi:MAG: hypothetical protein GXP19_09105 [Gammaproteobacteria bacterium]|nr:hypothetical protein [Gammaproteobacteria bacterium]
MNNKSSNKGMTLAMVFVVSVLTLSLVSSAQADSLGRIFTTPKQRVILDNIRRHPKQKKAYSTSAKAVLPSAVNVDGVVIRDDGKNTVWINGKNNINTNKPEVGVKVNKRNITSDSVTITLSNSNKRITLKPGQTVDPMTGKVRDAYNIK